LKCEVQNPVSIVFLNGFKGSSDVEVVVSIGPSEKKGGSDVGQGAEYNDPES